MKRLFNITLIAIIAFSALACSSKNDEKTAPKANIQFGINADDYTVERKTVQSGESWSKILDSYGIGHRKVLRLDELTREISSNPIYIAFATAQQALNKLMAEVNAEIKFCITGERDDCTHDCSTCSGCH